MNFYSLDGSKVDSNNLFENKQIYERFDNTNNFSSSLDNFIDENEEFASVPTTKSSATDNNYQCSDGYGVKGTTLGNDYKNINLIDCKKMCESAGNDCIGFNFDTAKNICTLKKDASSLMDSQASSTLCIKKSAGNANCKINTKNSNNDHTKAFNELDLIFNNQSHNNIPTGNLPTGNLPTGNLPTGNLPTGNLPTGNLPTNVVPTSKYPLEIPSVNVNPNQNSNQMATSSETTLNKTLNDENKTSNNENKPNMGNNSSGVYVDLDCFMKNISVLQNHTDNMMIDLSLLLSNLKTCSYVKKTSTEKNVTSGKMDTNQLINQVTSKINIPEPDVVKLKNIKADVLVTSDGTNSQMLEITKEPFSSSSEEKSNSWVFKDFMLIIILIILLFLLIFRK